MGNERGGVARREQKEDRDRRMSGVIADILVYKMTPKWVYISDPTWVVIITTSDIVAGIHS